MVGVDYNMSVETWWEDGGGECGMWNDERLSPIGEVRLLLVC